MFPKHGLSVNTISIMTLAMGVTVSKGFSRLKLIAVLTIFGNFFIMHNEVVVVVLASIASILITQVLAAIFFTE